MEQSSVVVRPAGEIEQTRKVAEDEATLELAQPLAAIDEAGDHGVTFLMRVVLRDRVDQSWRHRPAGHRIGCGEALRVAVRVEEQRAFLDVPAVVAAGDDAVDFLDVVLPDVADIEVAAFAVEGHAEGIAEAEREDLLDRTRLGDERIVRRNSILSVGGVAAVDVDAQDLPERGCSGSARCRPASGPTP